MPTFSGRHKIEQNQYLIDEVGPKGKTEYAVSLAGDDWSKQS